MFCQQQAATATAVDKQVTFDPACAVGHYGRNITAVVCLNRGNIGTGVLNTQIRDTVRLQQVGESAGIQMVAIVQYERIVRRRALFWRKVLLNH